MRTFRMTYRGTDGRRRESRKWAVEFRDHRGAVRRIAGFSDRAQTAELGRRIEKLVAVRANHAVADGELLGWFESMPPAIAEKLAKLDLLDEHQIAAANPLAEHLSDFSTSLSAKGNTEKHVHLVTGRARQVLEDCRFRFWSDISAARVEVYLQRRRESEARFSVQTSNFYAQAIRQFCAWMVQSGRAASSPLASLRGLNVRVDRRHDRRALSVEELQRLLDAARKGPERKGRTRDGAPSWSMTGHERAALYLLAMETGLRSGELRSLTRSSFDLRADPPVVTVTAAYSKRRRDDRLVLRAETVAVLRPLLKRREATESVFRMPRPDGVVRSLLRPDLLAARTAWIEEAQAPEERERRERSSFLAYRDAEGRFADFHSLRHSFITNVCRTGAHFKTAQDLARHSTPLLTARYTHGFRNDEVAAVKKLPALAGGTLTNSADNSASRGAEQCTSVQPGAVKSGRRRAEHSSRSRERRGETREMSGTWDGVPGRIRTCGLRFRKPLLYPPELRGRGVGNDNACGGRAQPGSA